MRKFLVVSVVAATMLMLLPALPASAAQMQADDPVILRGPLTDDSDGYSGERCETRRTRYEGQVIAVSSYCWTYVTLDPAAEQDADRDYSVLWVQGTVDTRNGWCAKKVSAGIAVADGTTVTGKTGRKVTYARTGRYVSKLRVDAAGTATTEAVVKQVLKLRRGTLDGRLLNDTDFKMVWRGMTARPVAVAGGIEFARAAGAGGPMFVPNMSPSLVTC